MKTRFSNWFLRYPFAACALPLGLALAARLVGISSRPIWYDEAFAVLFSEKGPAAMLAGTLSPTGLAAADIHPLGYYTMLWAWMATFGESLASVRGFSVSAGLATVVVAYAFALQLFGQRTGVVAGTLAALSPFQVHYGQEIRMYALLGLWMLLATYSYWRGSRYSGWPWWMAFSLFAALGQYTHNLAAFYLMPLALWPLFTRNWHVLRKVVLAGCLSIILYVPWLIHLPAQLAKVDQAYWIDRPEPSRLLTLLLAFTTSLPLRDWELPIGLLAAVLLTSLAFIQTLRWARHKVQHWQDPTWLCYLAFVPPLSLFLFSQWKPVYLERALLPSGVMFGIWVACSLAHASPPRGLRFLMVVAIVTGFSIGLYEHLSYSGFPYAPYKAIAESLRSRFLEGDVVVQSSKLSLLPTIYYDRDLPQRYVADQPGSGSDTLASSTQQVLGVEASQNIQLAVGHARRVWFIVFDESNQEFIRAGFEGHPDLTWLMQGYTLSEHHHWDTLNVYLFSLGS